MHISPLLTALALGLVTSLSLGQQAIGQAIRPCEGLIDITMISEPWDSYSRSYAEGAIRLFEAYVAPTMAAGAVIGILHPLPGDPYPTRVCTAVLHADPANPFFAEALVSRTTASYDPARGLTLRVPVSFPDFRQPIPAVEITINQATGQVSAR
ncbi:hypothetical protein MACH21_30600 [Roseicyclus marinus]|uniref:TonB C-terminal domain-containing protein n=1 Tax=Roseicyclus marinus TaxID=2161673 RepID=A0AA48HCD6_9RHOB|nr:hypothetical protein MACH21_30600 [Roseicyclus marinus]